MKHKWIVFIISLLLLLSSGCGMAVETVAVNEFAPQAETAFRAQSGEEEKICLAFLTGNMIKDGGVYTGYQNGSDNKELAKGHEVLSESEGLLLRYAVLAGEEAIYQEVKGYITGVLEQENYLSYRIDEESTPHLVNAAVDDLRIIRGLYEGGDAELADKYAANLLQTNEKRGLLVDFYSGEEEESGDAFTLCYGDLRAMEYAASENLRWEEIRDKTEQVMLKGYLGDAFPFFHTRYDVKKQTYSSDDINMVEALLTAFHLAEAGSCPLKTVEWLKQNLDSGPIYGTYSTTGDPLTEVESTAVYALCMMLGAQTGEQEIYEAARERMLAFQVTDSTSEVYGGFADSKTLTAHSFDNLMALLALRIECGQETVALEAKADVLVICDEDRQQAYEALLSGCGKRADYGADIALVSQDIDEYTYVISESPEGAELAEKRGKAVFSIGTDYAYGIEQEVVYQKDTILSFGFGKLVQTEEKRAELCYLNMSGEQSSFGWMELPFGKTVPYAVVENENGYASYFQEKDLSSVALSSALREFLGIAKGQGKFYVVIDEIYPFSDMEMLIEMGEALYENGIPYILRVMPVYENYSYPAFREFLDTLCYLQAKGGSVVLHEPIDQGTGYGPDVGESKLARAARAFKSGGVDVFPMEKMPVSISEDFLKRVSSSEKVFEGMPVDAMLILPVFEEAEAWQEYLELLSGKWLHVDSYRSLYTDKEPVYQGQDAEDRFVYREKEQAAMAGFFHRSSRVLLAVVAGAIAIFAVILISSRAIYNKKFRKP